MGSVGVHILTKGSPIIHVGILWRRHLWMRKSPICFVGDTCAFFFKKKTKILRSKIISSDIDHNQYRVVFVSPAPEEAKILHSGLFTREPWKLNNHSIYIEWQVHVYQSKSVMFITKRLFKDLQRTKWACILDITYTIILCTMWMIVICCLRLYHHNL